MATSDKPPPLIDRAEKAPPSLRLREEVLVAWDNSPKKSGKGPNSDSTAGESLEITPIKGFGTPQSDKPNETKKAGSRGMAAAAEALQQGQSQPPEDILAPANPGTKRFELGRTSNLHSGKIETIKLPLSYKHEQRDDAVKAAAKTGKLLVAFVGAPWCGYCVKMDKETVPSIEKNFKGKAVFTHVDADQDDSWKQADNDGLPQIRIFKVDKSGKRTALETLNGFHSTEQLSTHLKETYGQKYDLRPNDHSTVKPNQPNANVRRKR